MTMASGLGYMGLFMHQSPDGGSHRVKINIFIVTFDYKQLAYSLTLLLRNKSGFPSETEHATALRVLQDFLRIC